MHQELPVSDLEDMQHMQTHLDQLQEMLIDIPASDRCRCCLPQHQLPFTVVRCRMQLKQEIRRVKKLPHYNTSSR